MGNGGEIEKIKERLSEIESQLRQLQGLKNNYKRSSWKYILITSIVTISICYLLLVLFVINR